MLSFEEEKITIPIINGLKWLDDFNDLQESWRNTVKGEYATRIPILFFPRSEEALIGDYPFVFKVIEGNDDLTITLSCSNQCNVKGTIFTVKAKDLIPFIDGILRKYFIYGLIGVSICSIMDLFSGNEKANYSAFECPTDVLENNFRHEIKHILYAANLIAQKIYIYLDFSGHDIGMLEVNNLAYILDEFFSEKDIIICAEPNDMYKNKLFVRMYLME